MCGLDITFVKSIFCKRIVIKFFWDYCLNSHICNYYKRVVIGLLRAGIKCFTEWIPVKGCIEVVLSNLVSTSSCDIVVYWG